MLKFIDISCFKLSDVVFMMLINVKMPTIVGILTFMSMITEFSMRKFYTLGARFQLHAQKWDQPLIKIQCWQGNFRSTKTLSFCYFGRKSPTKKIAAHIFRFCLCFEKSNTAWYFLCWQKIHMKCPDKFPMKIRKMPQKWFADAINLCCKI